MNWRDFVPPILLKASATTRAILQVVTLGQPIWTPRRFDKLAKEGFESNVYVFRAVMEIAQACAGIPWLLYQRSRRQVTELEDHPLLDLLHRPNPWQGQAEFIEAAVAFLMLAGNSYVEAVGPASRQAPPQELYTLRPDRVTILPDAKNMVGGYRYTAGSAKQDFKAESVLHLKLFAPTDDWYGLAPLAVAARIVDQHNASNVWNTSLLQNGAQPPGALVAEEKLSDEEYDRLKKVIEERHSGPRNAGRPLLLEGGLDWKQMGLSPTDMAWLEGKKLTAREIAIVFGVPPELLGDSANKTYANYQEARRSFYTETVLPLMDRLRDKLNAWMVPAFGDNLYLDYDRDEIEALQEDRARVWTRVNSSFKAGWLRVNEARAAAGYDEDPEFGDLYAWQIAGMGLLDPGSDTGTQDAGKSAGRRLSIKAFNLADDEAKTAHWKATDNAREAWAGKIAGQMRARFEAEAKAVAQAVEGTTADQAEAAALAVIDSQRSDWERLLVATYLAVIEAFGNATLQSLKAEAGPAEAKAFDVWAADVQRFIAETAARKITQVTDTTKQVVRDALAPGLEVGEGIDDLAARIREAYKDFTPRRSIVIARTEVIGAAGFGTRAAAEQTGLQLEKEWIATRDERTRDSHAALDGERKQFNDRYSNGLMYPGDPDGEPEEVIQCRCAEGYHVVKE